MLQLATAFRAGGHDVLWATAVGNPSGDRRGDRGGRRRDPAEPRRRRSGVQCGAGPSVRQPGGVRFPRMFGEALTPPMVDGTGRPIARESGPDLLVHEQAELAAPLGGALC